MRHRTSTGNATWHISLRVGDMWWRATADTGSILTSQNWSLGLSARWSALPERRRGCCFVPLADERAAQTIGAVTLNGGSLPRASEAFLAHLGARSSKDAESRLK